MGAKAAVVIVAVLINGRPASLPTPAFLHGGHVFAPVRELFQQMGATVQWAGATKRVVISAGGRQVSLDAVAGTVRADGALLPVGAAPMLRGHCLFAPLRPLAEALGAKLRWQAGSKTLLIAFPLSGEPTDATIAAILASPQQYDGQLVRIAGEYRGWEPDPFSFATKNDPPATRSDWVLRDGTGHIYCSADVQPESDISLLPRSGLGRRIRVTGVCRTARSGVPYIEPTAVTAPGGIAGLTCSISTDKYVYKLGEAVRLTLTFGNALREPVTFERPSAQPYDFFVRARDGTEVWRWSQGRMFAMVVTSVRLEPGAMTQFKETWDQRTNVPGEGLRVPARYRVIGRIAPKIESYPATFEILR